MQRNPFNAIYLSIYKKNIINTNYIAFSLNDSVNCLNILTQTLKALVDLIILQYCSIIAIFSIHIT